MISKLRLLQIGDVHLPSAAKASRNVDQKDAAFSVELRNVISATPTKVVFKQMFELLDSGSIDSVLVMGDLTDKGSLKEYGSATAFLAGALQLGEHGNHRNIPVGIVPGNHDINRELAKKPGLATKFTPLNAHLRSNGLPTLPVETTKRIEIKKGQMHAHISLMNSCWGCGSIEYLPAEFRTEINKAIENSISSGGDAALQTYYDRQFDTPAFSNDSIGEIVSCAQNLPKNTLMIIVAHHNLLPQRLTRLAPYTELINSGPLRASLLQSNRSVLFLHGHIHEDPIEIVSTPEGQNLVCISAPAAEDGFNVLELNFTRMGSPLSCHVYPWRFNSAKVLSCGKSIAVPLFGGRRRSHDDSLAKIYGHLISKGEEYWLNLIKFAEPLFASDVEGNVREAVELLMADYSVEVDNYEYDQQNWIVRARV